MDFGLKYSETPERSANIQFVLFHFDSIRFDSESSKSSTERSRIF